MKRCGGHGESCRESTVLRTEAQKAVEFTHVVWHRPCRDDLNLNWIDLYFVGGNDMAEITGLLLKKKMHLLGLSFNPAVLKREKTVFRLHRCCSKVFPSHLCHPCKLQQISDDRLPSTVFISLSNVAGALWCPKGITLNCYNPLPLVRALFS